MHIAIGTRICPTTRGFVRLNFFRLQKLTVRGVLVACFGWPIVTRISSRAAMVVSAIGDPCHAPPRPDLNLLAKGEPANAVAVLMVLHLAIAIVTHNALVHLAPIRAHAFGKPYKS